MSESMESAAVGVLRSQHLDPMWMKDVGGEEERTILTLVPSSLRRKCKIGFNLYRSRVRLEITFLYGGIGMVRAP